MKTRNIIALLLALLMTAGVFSSAALADDAALKVSKSIDWTEGSDTAKVTVISDVPESTPKKVLFLGTLCHYHNMDSATVQKSLTAIAKNASVDYFLFNADNNKKASVAMSNHLNKGDTFTGKVTLPDSANHAALYGFAKTINSQISDISSYDYIVLEFDGSRIANDTQLPDDINSILDTCAGKLKPYYDENRVIWITDGSSTTSSREYGQHKYVPTNIIFTGGSDSSRSRLTTAQFRQLCALVAPSYYLANTTVNSTNYGDDTSDFFLADNYSLTPGSEVIDNVNGPVYYPDYARKDGSDYYVYKNDSRQMYYNNASDLARFLFMTIEGITVKLMDNIKVTDDNSISVTGAELFYSKSETIPTDTSAWNSLASLSVAAATVQTGTDTVKYVESTDGIIKITTGNTTASDNNKISVKLDNVKSIIKYIKLEVTLSDGDKFVSCIEAKTDGSGNPIFVMNPNNGSANIEFYQDKNATTPFKTGSAVADAPTLTKYTVTSQVIGGTHTQSSNGVLTTAADANPLGLVSYKGDTVTLTYTPDTDYYLNSIKIDGAEITLDADGKYSSDASSKKVTVEKNSTTGVVTVSFPALAADRASEVVFKSALSITKQVDTTKTTSPVRGGADVTYLITVYNESSVARTVTVKDKLDTSLVSPKAYTGASYDSTTGELTWSNVSVPAKVDGTIGQTILSVTVTVKDTVTAGTTENPTSLKNTARGYSNDKLFDEDNTETKLEGREITVNYSVAADPRPTGYTVPEAVTKTYGSNYIPVTTANVPGYTFKGWYTDEALTKEYDSDDALTKENYDSLKDGGSTVTLYGKWEYCVSLEKKLATTGGVRGGDTVTYNISVKNSSDSKITGVSVSDVLPDKLTYVENSAKIGAASGGSYDSASRTLSWTGIAVEAKSETVLSFQATVSDTITGVSTTITNTATGSFDGKDIDPSTSVEPVQPKLLIVQYNYVGSVPAEAEAKRPASVNVEYGSSYTAAADPSVNHYTFDGWYSDKDCTKEFTTGTITDYDKTTNIFNLYGKWTSIKSFTVTKDVKYNGDSVKDQTIYDGCTVTYAVRVTNTNPVAVVTATVTDNVPAGLENISGVSHSGVYSSVDNTVTWTITLPAGGSELLSFNATAAHTNTEKTYQNTAKVTAADGEPFNDPNPGTATFSTKPYTVILSCTKAWSDTWDSHESEAVQFKLTGTNGYVENFSLTKANPSFSKVMLAYTVDGVKIDYSFTELDTIGQPVAEGAQRGDYIVTSTVNENSTSFVNTYRIKPSDLNITKTAATTAVAGETLTYTLTVENPRDYETAVNVLVEDTLPAGLSLAAENALVCSNAADTATWNGGKVSWTIASLAPKATAQLEITVVIPAGVNAEQYENVAAIKSVAGSTSDPEKPSEKTITDVRSFLASVEWYMSDGTPDTNHPATAAVQLYADGNKYGEKLDVAVSNDWHNLQTYNGTNLVVYTVSEDPVEGYETVIEYYSTDSTKGNTSAVIKNYRKLLPVSYQLLGDDQPAAEDITPKNLDLTAKKVDWGTCFTPSEKPSAKYHEFAGWYADEDCTVEFNPATPITSATVIYGKWTRKTADITVVEPAEGPKDVKYPEDRTVKQGTAGGELPTPADPNNDYSFEGWYTDAAHTKPYDPAAIIDGDVQLYPNWTKNIKVTYTVENPPEGAITPSPDKLKPGTEYTSNPNHGSNSQYTFMGWYKDPQYTQKYVDGTVLNSDTVLYGKWIKNPVVSYCIVGTGPSGKHAPAAEMVGYGKSYYAAARLTYAGYTFYGWYTDPACTIPYVNGTVITKDTTLYGKWVVNNAVATGDDYNETFWVGLILLSAMAIVTELTFIKKRRFFR